VKTYSTSGAFVQLWRTDGSPVWQDEAVVTPPSYALSLSPTWKKLVRVGPPRAVKPLQEAVVAATSDNGGGLLTAGYGPALPNVGWYMTSGAPRVANYRTAIVLDPGEYTAPGEYIDIQGLDVIGATGDPKDVILNSGLGFVFNTRLDFYTSGITYRIVPRTTGGKNYTVHMTGSSLDLPTTNIFGRCKFIDEGSTVTGGWIGWDAPDNSRAHFEECEIISTRQSVFHGDITPVGVEIVYNRCSITVPKMQGNGAGLEFYYKGTTHNGAPVPDSTKTPAPLVNGSHRPARFTPVPAGGQVFTPAGITSPAWAAVAAGAVKYVPVKITAAGYVKSVSLKVRGSGAVAVGFYVEKSSTSTDTGLEQNIFRMPKDPGIYGKPVAVSSEQIMEAKPAGMFSPIYLTAEHTLWAAVLCTGSVEVEAGSVPVTQIFEAADQSELAAWAPAGLVESTAQQVPWVKINLVKAGEL